MHDNTDKHQIFVEASRYVKKVYKVVCDQVFNVLSERIPSDFLSLSKIVVIPCSDDDIADVIKSDKLNIHWMKHSYTDRWFADPYLLEVTDKQIVVLVEEFCYKLRKGRIADLL